MINIYLFQVLYEIAGKGASALDEAERPEIYKKSCAAGLCKKLNLQDEREQLEELLDLVWDNELTPTITHCKINFIYLPPLRYKSS